MTLLEKLRDLAWHDETGVLHDAADEIEELRGLLREARDELNVIASYKETFVTAGLRATAKAYDKLVMRIDAALSSRQGASA